MVVAECCQHVSASPPRRANACECVSALPRPFWFYWEKVWVNLSCIFDLLIMLLLAHILKFKQKQLNTSQSKPVFMKQHQLNLPAEAPHTNYTGAEQSRSKHSTMANTASPTPMFSASEFYLALLDWDLCSPTCLGHSWKRSDEVAAKIQGISWLFRWNDRSHGFVEFWKCVLESAVLKLLPWRTRSWVYSSQSRCRHH